MWEPLPGLVRARSQHACCVVRGGTLVALGGCVDLYEDPDEDPDDDQDDEILTASVEVQDTRAAGEAALSRELPQLSCGQFCDGTALVVDESESDAGPVLLLGGSLGDGPPSSQVGRVDLATGVCTPEPSLGREHYTFAAARQPRGRVVCAGGEDEHVGTGVFAELWEPTQGTWRNLPDMSVGRYGAAGCVMGNGRFAVLGGAGSGVGGQPSSSCEALALDGTERWEPMPPMHQARRGSSRPARDGAHHARRHH